MKTSTKVLVGLGSIGGIVGILYFLNKRFGFGEKLKVSVFGENIIGTGGIDNSPTEESYMKK